MNTFVRIRAFMVLLTIAIGAGGLAACSSQTGAAESTQAVERQAAELDSFPLSDGVVASLANLSSVTYRWAVTHGRSTEEFSQNQPPPGDAYSYWGWTTTTGKVPVTATTRRCLDEACSTTEYIELKLSYSWVGVENRTGSFNEYRYLEPNTSWDLTFEHQRVKITRVATTADVMASWRVEFMDL